MAVDNLKRKLMVRVALILLTILIVSNVISPATDCQYSNENGSFTFDEMNFKGRDFTMCLRKFHTFKKENNTDTVLYRLCSRNYFKFWNYKKYFFSEKYQLPYISWEKVDKRRGELINKSGFQDF